MTPVLFLQGWVRVSVLTELFGTVHTCLQGGVRSGFLLTLTLVCRITASA